MSATIGYPIDLHLHSTYSDGLKSPEELCGAAARLGLYAIALCDHDTVDGLAPMAKAVARLNAGGALPQPLRFIPSIELSAGSDGHIHILGYGANPRSPSLTACLHAAQTDRTSRAARILARLAALGIALDPDLLDGLKSPAIGRAHIARAMVKDGVVNTVQQAFDRYLAQGKSAYVPRKLPSAADAVSLLKDAGAVVVLAHPCRLSLGDAALNALIKELMGAGLDGLEIYHPSTSRTAVRRLEPLARRNDLLVTGGSDYHGDANTRVSMAHMPSGWLSWAEDLEALLSRVKHT